MSGGIHSRGRASGIRRLSVVLAGLGSVAGLWSATGATSVLAASKAPTASRATTTVKAGSVTTQDWPTYLHDAARTSVSGDTTMNPANVQFLQKKFTTVTGG